jgi:two-component system, LytTR family, sensor kinase
VKQATPTRLEALRRSRWTVWGGFVFFWTFFGVFLAFPRVLFHPIGWTEALRMAVLDMYSWGLVALAAIAIAARFPLIGGRWARLIPLHLGLATLVLLARFFAANAFVLWLGWIPSMPPAEVLVQVMPFNFILYFALLGAGYAVDYYRRYRARELETSRLAAESAALETQLVESRLQSLKMQLQPHFLFNTLNAISSLVREDPERAQRMIAHLGDLLRATLDRGAQQEVTVKEEVELLQPYLEIEKARFGDRLTVELDVDPAVLDSPIPHLLLQPLVENAMNHGIAPRGGPGSVRISVRPEAGRLRVRVADDGLGFGGRRPARGDGRLAGLGLANIRERLHRLYGSEHEFRAGDREGGGALVEVALPLRESVAATAIA